MLYLQFFRLKNFHFFISLYKELIRTYFCLIVLDNLCDVFDWWVFIFDCVTDFEFFFFINDWWCSLALQGLGIFSNNLFASTNIFFFQAFHLIITVFLRKFKLFTTIFKDKVSDFIDRHLFYSSSNISDIHYYILENTKSKKNDLIVRKK